MAFTAAGYDNFVNNTMFTVLDAIRDSSPDMVRDVFNKVPWTPGQGDTVQFTSLSLPSFGQRVDENESYPESNPIQADTLTKRQIQYGVKMNISRKMALFNKYPEAINMARNLVLQLQKILDLELTVQVFNEADQTTFVPKGKQATAISTSDGLALQSDSHTVQGTGSTAYDNSATAGALNLSNLTTAIQLGQANTVDDFGTALSPNFNALVVSDDGFMVKKALELTGSNLTPESSNNAVNVYAGPTMKVLQLKYGTRSPTGGYVTDNRYAWALWDLDMLKQGGAFQYQQALEPIVEPKFLSSDNLVASLLATQFAAFAAVRWQGTVYNRSTTQP